VQLLLQPEVFPAAGPWLMHLMQAALLGAFLTDGDKVRYVHVLFSCSWLRCALCLCCCFGVGRGRGTNTTQCCKLLLVPRQYPQLTATIR
jgi:hypothetical protein